VSGLRSPLGAVQNRLEHTYNANALTVENLTATESKIRDADMAFEMTTFTRQQPLVQTSASMLAQANQVRRSMVQLLTA
jgi:flagellin